MNIGLLFPRPAVVRPPVNALRYGLRLSGVCAGFRRRRGAGRASYRHAGHAVANVPLGGASVPLPPGTRHSGPLRGRRGRGVGVCDEPVAQGSGGH